jgi:hypothetical protein
MGEQQNVLVGKWTVLLAVDVDGHLTINAYHGDGSETVDISDEYGDEGFKARLTTRRIEDDALLAKLPEEPWPLESFDPHSELTKERAGDEADALAEYRESERRGY